MPTYEVTDTFRRDLKNLSRAEKVQLKDAVEKFIADLKAVDQDPSKSIRAGLRVKPYQRGPAGVMELTWAPDGRALFMFGDRVRADESHVVWLRVGSHKIL